MKAAMGITQGPEENVQAYYTRFKGMIRQIGNKAIDEKEWVKYWVMGFTKETRLALPTRSMMTCKGVEEVLAAEESASSLAPVVVDVVEEKKKLRQPCSKCGGDNHSS